MQTANCTAPPTTCVVRAPGTAPRPRAAPQIREHSQYPAAPPVARPGIPPARGPPPVALNGTGTLWSLRRLPATSARGRPPDALAAGAVSTPAGTRARPRAPSAVHRIRDLRTVHSRGPV